MSIKVSMTAKKTCSKKATTRNISEGVIKEIGYKSKKQYIQHARTRWEALRRNKKFRRAFNRLKKYENDLNSYSPEENKSDEILCKCIKQSQKIKNEWGVFSHVSLKQLTQILDAINIDLSFEENAYILNKEHKKPPEVAFLYFGSLIYTGSESDYYCYDEDVWSLYDLFDDDEEMLSFRETGTIAVTLDLMESKNMILARLKDLIDELQPQLEIKEEPQRNYRYDLHPMYFKVYDMREKDKMTYKAIAQKLISDGDLEENLDKDPRGPEIKTMQYYKKAKELIEDAPNF